MSFPEVKIVFIVSCIVFKDEKSILRLEKIFNRVCFLIYIYIHDLDFVLNGVSLFLCFHVLCDTY